MYIPKLLCLTKFDFPLCFRSYSAVNHFPVPQKAVSVTISTHMELIMLLQVAIYMGFEHCYSRWQPLFLTVDEGIRRGVYLVNSGIIA